MQYLVSSDQCAVTPVRCDEQMYRGDLDGLQLHPTFFAARNLCHIGYACVISQYDSTETKFLQAPMLTPGCGAVTAPCQGLALRCPSRLAVVHVRAPGAL